MAKTDATRCRKRLSKVVISEAVEEDDVNTEGQTETLSSSAQMVGKEEAAPTEMKQEEEDQDEQDSQMDAVIEVKGSKSTVSVSWDKKNEDEEGDDSEKKTDASDQMKDSGEPVICSDDAVGAREDAPSESTETDTKQESGGIANATTPHKCEILSGASNRASSSESQMDTEAGETESTPAVTVTWENKEEKGESNDITKESDGSEQMKETAVNGKRKAQSTVETSPSKKTKLINDGFCLFVGNLNNTKTFEEVRDALGNYFMTQSLLVQDIRLDRSKKHAHVDLASQMDLTKALTLNGEMVLDKPMKISKAKIQSADKVKVKVSAEDKKAAKNARCLFLKNIPYNATKQDILKIFRKAVDVRFPGGAEGPNKGIAFVEFKNKSIAKKVQQKKRVAKIQDRVLIVDFVGEGHGPKVTKANDNNNNTKAAPSPNNTLFVSNVSYNVKEEKLKKVFQKAVSITIPQSKGKPRGFAFVEFSSVEDAEKALQSTQNMKIGKRKVRVQFCTTQEKSETAKVLSKTLIVMGLAEKTSADTLKGAFEGAISARVILDKETGVSKRFGFVEFETDENCKAVKESMEDCEIDGSKVTVTYAKSKGENGPAAARGGLVGDAAGQPAGQRAARGGRKDRGGKGRGAVKPQDAVEEVGNKG